MDVRGGGGQSAEMFVTSSLDIFNYPSLPLCVKPSFIWCTWTHIVVLTPFKEVDTRDSLNTFLIVLHASLWSLSAFTDCFQFQKVLRNHIFPTNPIVKVSHVPILWFSPCHSFVSVVIGIRRSAVIELLQERHPRSEESHHVHMQSSGLIRTTKHSTHWRLVCHPHQIGSHEKT